MQSGAEHLPADSATVAAFWRVWFALANVLAFRKTLCGGIGGRWRLLTHLLQETVAFILKERRKRNVRPHIIRLQFFV
jgi:hypothetical protein